MNSSPIGQSRATWLASWLAPLVLLGHSHGSLITLRAGSDRLEVQTTVHNNIRDHRLRVLFPSGAAAAQAASIAARQVRVTSPT